MRPPLAEALAAERLDPTQDLSTDYPSIALDTLAQPASMM